MGKPQRVLAHAKELLKTADSDEAHATVVNRAYLAAYNGAKEFHDSLPLPGRCQTSQGVHETLIKRLEQPDPSLNVTLISHCKYIAAQLRMLKPLRAIADYETDQQITASDSEEAIRLADDILDECNTGLRIIAQAKSKATPNE